LIVIFPVPAVSQTRATAVFRRPVAVKVSLMVFYE
jgi:hypothetical protein